MAATVEQSANADSNDKKFEWTTSKFFNFIWTFVIKLFKSITVEPMVAFWVLPGSLFYSAMENLGLEKTCRVNLGLNNDVCSNMINRTLNNIECTVTNDWLQNNKTIVSLLEYNNTTSSNLHMNSSYDSLAFFNGSSNLLNLTLAVCNAEIESQKIVAIINGYRSPIASIFPIIIILFAGGWSDRKNLVKPCMIAPLVGEFLGCLALLITSIFMYKLPMEFGSILEKILPAMTGGTSLMLMGIYNYLTSVTAEEDRTFRFGLFAVCLTIFPILGLTYTGVVFELLGYVWTFSLGLILYAMAMLYAIFVLKEPRKSQSEDTSKDDQTLANTNNGTVNPGFEDDDGSKKMEKLEIEENGSHKTNDKESSTTKRNCFFNFLVEFFDPAMAIGCVRAVLKVREHKGRFIVLFLLLAYFLLMGSTIGEAEYYYVYGRLKLNWSAIELGPYLTYQLIIGLVGTGIMIVLFSKLLKLSDSMIGFISTVFSIISRPVIAFALSTITMYIGATLDLFTSLRAIAIKSIISAIVEENELGRIYSVLGILDAMGLFIFPPLYAVIYINTLETMVGAFFLVTMGFFIPPAIIFLMTYFLVQKRKKMMEPTDTDAKQSLDNPVPERSNKLDETTYL